MTWRLCSIQRQRLARVLQQSSECSFKRSSSTQRARTTSSAVGGGGGGKTQAAVQCLLEREWLLPSPAVEITAVREGQASFSVLRDDLAHPFLGGNKMRKLDGLWPEAITSLCTDVVTCGGLQSAHTTAVAAVAAQHGIRAHLLVRGEQPAVPTGHYLYARMLAHAVQHVSRAEYADRQAMLDSYVQQLVAGGQAAAPGSIAVIPEGAAEPGSLLGLIRLVSWLAEQPVMGSHCAGSTSRSNSGGRSSSSGGGSNNRTNSSSNLTLVVDSGTGATTSGLALGVALLQLPWRVVGVMLAGPEEYYCRQQQQLTRACCSQHGLPGEVEARAASLLDWVPRLRPRKFGKVLPGEVARCRQLAQRHGIVLDPIWSLAAWEVAEQLAAQQGQQGQEQGRQVAMLHTGGMLGLCGLAQRFPDDF